MGRSGIKLQPCLLGQYTSTSSNSTNCNNCNKTKFRFRKRKGIFPIGDTFENDSQDLAGDGLVHTDRAVLLEYLLHWHRLTLQTSIGISKIHLVVNQPRACRSGVSLRFWTAGNARWWTDVVIVLAGNNSSGVLVILEENNTNEHKNHSPRGQRVRLVCEDDFD